MNSSDNILIVFRLISKFVNELATEFGSKTKSLKLYKRLLSRTTLTHEEQIKKHVEAFRVFCFENRDALQNKNNELFKNDILNFSNNVFIDFKTIFKYADEDAKNVIWKHLLFISAYVDPAGKAKEVLKSDKTNKEANFLSDILDKVETNVSPDANPFEAMTSIMQSGVFTELISNMNNGIQDGSLDLGKLIGNVQQMCTSIGATAGEGNISVGDSPNPMDMLSSIMNTSGGGGGAEGMPDLSSLSSLTSLLGPMLSNMTKAGGGTTVEEIEQEVNKKLVAKKSELD